MATDYASLIQAHAQQRGISPQVALAMFKQESSLNPGAMGDNGQSAGIGQIQAATAADPGYGMAPISDADRLNPEKSIPWSLDYLKAKANHNGVMDLSTVDGAKAALPFYNGGGDPNYVNNVMSRMDQSGDPMGAPKGPAGPTTPAALQQMQQMPDSFGRPSGIPSPAAKVDTSGHEGDGLVSTGMAMMGGNGFSGAMRAGGEAYDKASARAAAISEKNAGFQNDAYKRDFEAPEQAALAAGNRAKAWEAMNAPTSMTANQLALDARYRDMNKATNDARVEAAQLRSDYMRQAEQARQDGLKSTDRFVDRGPDGVDAPKYYQQQTTRGGSTTVLGPDGKPTDMPSTAVPQSADQRPDPVTAANIKANTPAIDNLAKESIAARDQDERFSTALEDIRKPGANMTPGLLGNIGRGLDSAMGTSIFGNLNDTQIADAMLKQDMLGQFAKAGKSGQRVTDSLRGFITSAQPHMGQAQGTIEGVTSFLQAQNRLPIAVNEAWQALSPGKQREIKTQGSVAQWADKTKADIMDAALKSRQAARDAPAPTSAPGASASSRPPLSSFYGGGGPSTPNAPPGNTDLPPFNPL